MQPGGSARTSEGCGKRSRDQASAVSAAASRIGLEIPPGPRFGVDGTLERFIRVPYTLPEPKLVEAIELLARAWRSVTGMTGPEPAAVVV